MKRKTFNNLIKIILPPVFIIVLSVLIWQGLRYAIVDDSESYSRVMMHEMYQQENIDILFTGASLCFRAFNPSVLDEELQANTFNAATASQNIDVTYYLTKDILASNNVRHVFLDVGPSMALTYHTQRTMEDMVSAYAITDYMKWSPQKIAALMRGSASDYMINSFLPARRNWKDIFDIGRTRYLLQKKSEPEYRDYGYKYIKHDNEQYLGKGYVESDTRVDEGGFINAIDISFLSGGVDEGWYYYINKIADLCRKNGTELTLVCTPLPDYTLAVFEDFYNEYHEKIKTVADEAGVELWDFICVKDEYMSTVSGNFMDPIHLNSFGANDFSRLFASVAKGELTIEEITFSSSQEKLNSGDTRVLGITNTFDGEKTITTNSNGELEFKVVVRPSDKEEYVLQDFSTNATFSLPEDESGTFTVTSRNVDRKSEQREYNYEFGNFNQ